MSKGFGMLTSLKELNMNNCVKLESLPESESRLTSHFLISNFGNLMSEGFGDLRSLTSLNLSSSDRDYPMALKSLPDSKCFDFTCMISNFGNLISEGFGQLANLKSLDLWYCTSLRSLPESKSHF